MLYKTTKINIYPNVCYTVAYNIVLTLNLTMLEMCNLEKIYIIFYGYGIIFYNSLY
jgi:hypothetical protein